MYCVVSLLMALLDRHHIRQSSLQLVLIVQVLNTGSTLDTVETVVRVPKDIVLTPTSLRCSRLVGPGEDFVAICIVIGLSIS